MENKWTASAISNSMYNVFIIFIFTDGTGYT
jgi:hypothetical protein